MSRTAQAPSVNLQEYFARAFAAGQIDHALRVTTIGTSADGQARAQFYIHPATVDGETLDLIVVGSRTTPAAHIQHTDREDFDHFLSYSGLYNEPEDVKVKLFQAFQAAR